MFIRTCLTSAALFCLCLTTTSWAQETISFPARASDIPADAIWAVNEFSEGSNIMDFNVQRWSNQQWRESNGSANSNSFDWGVPLYAPASGYIIACWRNFPDHPSPATQHARRSEMFGGGNFIFLLSDQGTGISINHLQARSIPAGLCPANDVGDAEFPSSTQKVGEWRVASYVDPSNWQRVREGQLGRQGLLQMRAQGLIIEVDPISNGGRQLGGHRIGLLASAGSIGSGFLLRGEERTRARDNSTV